MKVNIWSLKENNIREFEYAEELVEFYKSSPEMIEEGNISTNNGTRTHKYLKGKHFFLFYSEAPRLFISRQCLMSPDGLTEHTGMYHIWAAREDCEGSHILCSLHPEHFVPETAYGENAADEVKASKEMSFINSPLFERRYMEKTNLKPIKELPKPGDKIKVNIGGVYYDTLIDKAGIQRFIPNRLYKHLSGGGGYNIVQLTQDYINGAFGRREFLEFLMGLGIPVAQLEEMSVFQNLDFINPMTM
jgi:hypothetical protein